MADAATIKVLCTNAITEAYHVLVPQFERGSGHTVVTVWGGTNAITGRLRRDEQADLAIMAGPSIDGMIKEGKLVAGSRVDIARVGVGVAVRAGAPRPDISTADGLKRALLAAKSIGYSSGPSGAYVGTTMFERLGIADAVKGKLTQTEGIPVGEVVARGEVEIGFQQVSELLPVAGIQFLGPLPAELQNITVFSAGLRTNAAAPAEAKALVAFLTAPAAVPTLKAKGLDPA
jgi:molybdate transport system substrate-binding protein